MAAPMDDLTPEQRAEIAADCDKAVELLERDGWRRHGLFSYDAETTMSYVEGGSLCAVGALAAARWLRQVGPLPTVDSAYPLVGGCLTGLAVIAEIVHRQADNPEVMAHHERLARRSAETEHGIAEYRAYTIVNFNDQDVHSSDEIIDLLRDVATKHRPDAMRHPGTG